MTYVRKYIYSILLLALVYCTAAQANPIRNDELFDVALLGLVKPDPELGPSDHKYDTSVSCFSGAAGLYINSTKKRIYAGYSSDSVKDAFTPMGDLFDPIRDAYDPVSYSFIDIVNSSKIGQLLVLSISSIEQQGDSIIIAAHSVRDGKFLLSFSKTEENILTLTLLSSPQPQEGWGDWGFGQVYTNAQYESEYDSDACEGFQG